MGTETYTFKEICKRTEYKSSVIRYYEKEFQLNIPRDSNGRRIFTNKELDKLLYIKKLQQSGYTNSQIKKLLEPKNQDALMEISATMESSSLEPAPIISKPENVNLISHFEEKLNEINTTLSEISQNVISKDKDILLTENMKLKMELKQRAYEIMELKEKLRCEKEQNKSFFSKILSKKK